MPSDKKEKDVALYRTRACPTNEGIFEEREGNEGTTWISGEGSKSAADRRKSQCKVHEVMYSESQATGRQPMWLQQSE